MLAEVDPAAESIQFSIFFFTNDALRDVRLADHQARVTFAGVLDQLGMANAYSEDEILCAAGIPTMIEDIGGKLHDKFMVIDAGGTDQRVVTGSMNWTEAGADEKDENSLIVHDAAVAQTYQAAFRALYDALGP